MHPELRALIVDDERLARRELRQMLTAMPGVEVCGEADLAESARGLIRDLRPDVLFLDIRMPGESGLDLLSSLENPPRVVFVTAYDTYAVRAFTVNAVDYLLKPVDARRLEETVRRLVEGAPRPEPEEALAYDDVLFLPDGQGVRVVKVDAVVALTAEGDYSRLHLRDGRSALALRTMNEWETRLPERYFVRIHRSTIVSLRDVLQMEKWHDRSLRLRVDGCPETLIASRRYTSKLRQRFL